MKATHSEPWNDADYAFLADHEDWTARRVAEALGKSTQAVYTKRWRLKQGWEPVASARWDISEDETIVAAGAYARVDTLMGRLPGRTAEAIQSRRSRLGVEVANSNHKRPEVIGARPLIAKTCTRCGLLLQADWFVFLPRQRQWTPDCKKCRSGTTAARHARNGRVDRKRQHEAAARSTLKQQALTVPRAHRAREPYIEKDHQILGDPDLTIFQKALKLQRTYIAARAACSRYGYRSHVGLGDPDRDVWVIDNPNIQALA